MGAWWPNMSVGGFDWCRIKKSNNFVKISALNIPVGPVAEDFNTANLMPRSQHKHTHTYTPRLHPL